MNKHVKKRGQANTEYMIITVLLFLLLTFFAYLALQPLLLVPFGTDSVASASKDLSNQDVVEILAESTRTVANLNHVGTGLEITIHKFAIASNSFKGGEVTVVTSTGEVFSAAGGAPDVYAHKDALNGFGVAKVKIKKTYLGAVGVGNGPTFSGICPQDVVYPSREVCSSTSFPTSEGVYFIGTNLEEVNVAYLAKLTSGNKPPQTIPTCAEPECTKHSDCSGFCITDRCVCAAIDIPLPSCVDIDCDLKRFIPQSATGVGTYIMAVATPRDVQSNSKVILMRSSS